MSEFLPPTFPAKVCSSRVGLRKLLCALLCRWRPTRDQEWVSCRQGTRWWSPASLANPARSTTATEPLSWGPPGNKESRPSISALPLMSRWRNACCISSKMWKKTFGCFCALHTGTVNHNMSDTIIIVRCFRGSIFVLFSYCPHLLYSWLLWCAHASCYKSLRGYYSERNSHT
jgi:hypothetical protein